MNLILRFKEENFEDPKVAAAVKALLELEPTYTKMGKANVLGSQLLTMAQTFRRDQQAIFDLISPEDHNQSKRKIKKPVKFVKPNNRKYKRSQGGHNEGCIDCGSDDTEQPTSTSTGSENQDNQDVKITSLEDLKNVKSFRDILELFDDSFDKLSNFCKVIGLKIGNTKDINKIAKKIFDRI